MPTDVQEAAALLAEGSPKIIAGCTDFFPGQKQGSASRDLLDVTRISGLRGILERDEGWRIGAATTWSEIAGAVLPPAFEGLKQAALEVGSLQIQNLGTIAGNICNASPAADGVPPLLTLNASVELASLRGPRRVPLSEFITGVRQIALAEDEFVVAIHIPRPAQSARGAFEKLGSRAHLVISIAMAASVVELRNDVIVDAALAVGSCAPVARRLPELEAFLVGKSVGELKELPLSNAEFFAPLSPISDVRGSAEYRLDVVAELCRRVVMSAVSGGDHNGW
ncbi:MAG: xanthine dehydrogenase [Rhodobacterales bacterium]|nr:MAG: xanthine dehydrogenase [Rhodobacterales bacterium]